ncbi:uncharacterized protein LOC132201261 [Neocloeon triangulifer]|uniref:uncharacterized protein LOC132201261 n=1 Tax=Neocloeon triangulifer TaxID=2078957 RepID=UPI00286F7B20|nr:uncharacterized protein LOC132201261 [Neocloeon triangulifer]
MGDLDDKSPRKSAEQLRQDVALSLKNNGANTRAPCPMADAIFESLFGRLWMQSDVIRAHKPAEQIFELLKLDHDATLDFFRNRRESTLRKTVFAEEDEELQEIRAAVTAAETKLAALQKSLKEVEEQEKLEMANWLAQYGVERLVLQERISVLKAWEGRVNARVEQLDEDRDLLDTTNDLLGWVQTL